MRKKILTAVRLMALNAPCAWNQYFENEEEAISAYEELKAMANYLDSTALVIIDGNLITVQIF